MCSSLGPQHDALGRWWTFKRWGFLRGLQVIEEDSGIQPLSLSLSWLLVMM
jgi:hypothetical protein